MGAKNQKAPAILMFSSEHQEADWWASPEGRRFLKGQRPQPGLNSGHGSKRVTQLAHATNAQTTPAVRAEPEPKAQLEAAFNRFVAESDPSAENQAARDLIRSIFGPASLPEDPSL